MDVTDRMREALVNTLTAEQHTRLSTKVVDILRISGDMSPEDFDALLCDTIDETGTTGSSVEITIEAPSLEERIESAVERAIAHIVDVRGGV